MTKNSTTTAASGLRPDTDWVSLYRSALVSALREWPSDEAAARTSVEELRSELEDLASPKTSWSDGKVIGRVVRAAAACEAVAVAQHGGFVTPEAEAAAPTSAFALILRELRHDDCGAWFPTIPRRLLEAAEQLKTVPEEASCEAQFLAAMLVTDLRSSAPARRLRAATVASGLRDPSVLG